MHLLSDVETGIENVLRRLEKRDRRLSLLYARHCTEFSKLTRLCGLLRLKTSDNVETINDSNSIQCSLLRRTRHSVALSQLEYLESVVSSDAIDSVARQTNTYYGARIPMREDDVQRAVTSLHCDMDRFVHVRTAADGVVHVNLHVSTTYETLDRRLAIMRRLRELFHFMLDVFAIPEASVCANVTKREVIHSELFFTRVEVKRRLMRLLEKHLSRAVASLCIDYSI